jgi:hypothetical protein
MICASKQTTILQETATASNAARARKCCGHFCVCSVNQTGLDPFPYLRINAHIVDRYMYVGTYKPIPELRLKHIIHYDYGSLYTQQ